MYLPSHYLRSNHQRPGTATRISTRSLSPLYCASREICEDRQSTHCTPKTPEKPSIERGTAHRRPSSTRRRDEPFDVLTRPVTTREWCERCKRLSLASQYSDHQETLKEDCKRRRPIKELQYRPAPSVHHVNDFATPKTTCDTCSHSTKPSIERGTSRTLSWHLATLPRHQLTNPHTILQHRIPHTLHGE
jgi:hypothetical protein